MCSDAGAPPLPFPCVCEDTEIFESEFVHLEFSEPSIAVNIAGKKGFLFYFSEKILRSLFFVNFLSIYYFR